MKTTTCLLLAAALTATVVTGAQPGELRRSPSYSVRTPDGTMLSLESYRGRVVLLAFINTECPHCQRTSQMMGRLQAAYGDEDVQALAVAINANAAKLVPFFVERTGITFPVGVDSATNARKYLAIPSTGVVLPPALVVIDRQGTIQAEFGGDDPAADDEAMLRALVDRLVAQRQTSARR